MPSGIRPRAKAGYIPKRRYQTPSVNWELNVGGLETHFAAFLAIIGEKGEKRPNFSEKSEKKGKLTLNLPPKMRILKYKGKRIATSASRN